jgi:dihydrofolate synthase/folylpolyglutamate synthase
MIASILQSSGYKVGLYTSPHLVDLRERIRINGKMILKNEFLKLFKIVRSKKVKLTYFEFLTSLAFLYFKKQKVDFLVLEVGLGGRLDATNVANPLISVITNIELEHTDVLGDTVEKIAHEKACIIKKNSVAVTNSKGKALDVIRKFAEKKNSEFIKAKNHVKKIHSDLEKQIIVYKDQKINFPLLGDFQLENADTSLETLEALKNYGVKISQKNIKNGLEKTQWPGRLEVVQKNPLIIMDCAHNPSGIKALKKFIKTLKYKKLNIIFGVSSDKDYKSMVKDLMPMADKIILTRAKTQRALDPETIALNVKDGFFVDQNAKEAYEYAGSLASKNDLILITGSIYLVGDVKAFMYGKAGKVKI